MEKNPSPLPVNGATLQVQGDPLGGARCSWCGPGRDIAGGEDICWSDGDPLGMMVEYPCKQ